MHPQAPNTQTFLPACLPAAYCRRERTTKRLQMEASIIAHAWLTPAIFLLYALREGGARSAPQIEAGARFRHAPQAPNTQTCLPACCCLLPVIIMDWTVSIHLGKGDVRGVVEVVLGEHLPSPRDEKK